MRNKIYMTVQEAVIGAGTGNYNKLQNKPVVNLVGSTQEKHVNLSGLTQGKYTLLGYYVLTEGEPIKHQGQSLDVTVFEHEVSSSDPEAAPIVKKIVCYTYAKDEEIWLKEIVYGDGNTFEKEKDVCLTVDNGGGGENTFWEEGQ